MTYQHNLTCECGAEIRYEVPAIGTSAGEGYSLQCPNCQRESFTPLGPPTILNVVLSNKKPTKKQD